jgi:hypothetical protein
MFTEAQIKFATTRMAFSKKTKDAVKQKCGGRCAYCGRVSDKLCIDHVHPVERGHLLLREGKDVHHIDNLMPACFSCNNYKSSYDLEGFRRELGEQIGRARRQSVNFRLAERFGLIQIIEKPIVFYFEQSNPATSGQE